MDPHGDPPVGFDAMYLSRNFLEKAGPDVMAISILTHLNAGATQQAAILAKDAACNAERTSHSELNGLAAAALEKHEDIDGALAHWDAALEGPGSKMKWLEGALRFAWRMNTESAGKAAERWQKLLENLFSEVPSPQFLHELDQHGWQGKGSLGIKDGKLMGWLWLDTDEKPEFEFDKSRDVNYSLTLKASGETGGKRLYTISESAPQKEFCLLLKDGSGRLIQGCPVFFSPPSLVQSGKKQENRVTILIPVYGDREATLACLGSVLASKKKNRTETEILAIWDCGTDQRLLGDLRKLAQREKLRLSENPRNMGFLASVNRGMSQIKSGHVLLLNADTIVHGDWVDRMMAIGERKNAATVTALSNQAELMSYPSKQEPGIIESLSQTKIMDRAAAQLGDQTALEIPTGVGFCMLVMRRVLSRIGGLDGNMLFRGYGEEVEFCLRARDAGMVNYGAFNVFVAHRGERSFGQAKKALAHQNNTVIFEKYPDHRKEYRVFVAQQAGKEVRQKISLELIKNFAEFDFLELRPWAARNLLPWTRERKRTQMERSAILFIKAGSRPEALLKITAELPVGEMRFDLTTAPESLGNALRDLNFRKAINYELGEAALQLVKKAGVSEYEEAQAPPLAQLPKTLQAGGSVLGAPPMGQRAWKQLCLLAKENPATSFYIFNLDKLWDGVPRPANIHSVNQEVNWQSLGPEIFLCLDRNCDAPAWQQRLRIQGDANLTFCSVDNDGER